MILVVIRMEVLPEKHLELSQTITLLIGSIRSEKGCLHCECCQNIDNKNRLYLLEEWDSRESLLSYLKSEQFKVLRGARNLLKEPFKMMFHTIFYLEGLKGDLVTTNLNSKNIEQLMAEADELVQKINSEFIEDLEEEHRLQFEKHTQRLQELKSEVQAKHEGKGIIESFSSAEGMHEAIVDIVKAMKDLTSYLT
jgi:quinol monooxygenase YgiN